MLKHWVKSQFVQTLESVAPNLGALGQPLPVTAKENHEGGEETSAWHQLRDDVLSGIRVEQPKNREHGDYAVNFSYLARWAKLAPPAIAGELSHAFSESVTSDHSNGTKAQAAAGFVNITLSPQQLCGALVNTLSTPHPGKNTTQSDARVLLEYVSANPTGPLHIGHGRWAALGDSLRRILQHCDAKVDTEFYVNDFGNQMGQLTLSVYYRCLEVLGKGGLPAPVEGEKYPYYPGEYLLEAAKEYLADAERHQTFEAFLQELEQSGTVQSPTVTLLYEKTTLKPFTQEAMLAEQRRLLQQMNVPFDVWFPESSLHQDGRVQKTLETLKKSGYTEDREGALWFKTSELGDEKDRVLVKSDGSYTYLTADVAYHHDKFNRTGTPASPYNCVMNIWGADHHGYIPRMKAAVQALGHDPNQLEIVLGQLVNLVIDGEKTRMGKRKKMLTLSDVVDEVGVDATRFWMVLRSADTTLDFDVELAASATDENPVFYVQYAHARCASIVRNATQPVLNTETGEMVPAKIAPEALAQFLSSMKANDLAQVLFAPEHESTHRAIRDLILLLDSFEDKVGDAAVLRSPHLVVRYAMDLAACFHSFYAVCRVITEDETLTLNRLALIVAIQKTLAQALELLGVSAPEKM